MGEMREHAYSETAIKRALATYLPPAMVQIILGELGSTLQESAPVPTDEDHKAAQQLLRRWGIVGQAQ